MRSSDANCRPKRRKTHLCLRWSSLHQITSLPSHDSGISCVNCASSRRQLERLSLSSASTRELHWRSRTSASGCVMIHVREHTTCTVNTVTWPSAEPSLNATVTWLPVIVLALIQSRWGFVFECNREHLKLTHYPIADHQNWKGGRHQDSS